MNTCISGENNEKCWSWRCIDKWSIFKIREEEIEGSQSYALTPRDKDGEEEIIVDTQSVEEGEEVPVAMNEEDYHPKEFKILKDTDDKDEKKPLKQHSQYGNVNLEFLMVFGTVKLF